MNKYKNPDIIVNGSALLIGVLAIIFITNWPTGAFVAPFFYIFYVLSPLTTLQLIAFWVSVKRNRSKLNWTISIPIIVFVLTIFFTIKFATDCPYYEVG